MKQVILLFLVYLSFSSLYAQQENRVEGFRDVKWGSRLESSYKNDSTKLKFIRIKNIVDRNTYYLENEPMNIGSVKLNAVQYSFSSDNRFYKVVLIGDRSNVEDMKFILNYKFDEFENKSEVDGVKYFQWIVQDVTFTLSQFEMRDFELSIESDWKAAEKYDKNTSIEDF